MSDDPVRKYLDAKKEFDDAQVHIQDLQQIIGAVHSGLHRPFTFIVTGTDVTFSPEVIAAKTTALNGEEWPGAPEIAQALASLQQSYKLLETYWKAIPEADRRNITPPPGRR
ncbi:MAG: hypothetical protein PHR43_07225 [Dehalococcoidales bacterium]|nr:hypothetical protein [Dehalococcoidales bacterium]